MSAHTVRAHQLISQGRWSEAAEQLRQALAQDPGDAYTLALLALCEANAERPREAIAAAQAALAADADLDFAHFAHARALLADHRPVEAEAAVRRALAIDPHDADHHALLASCLSVRSEFSAALAAAEAGLAIDPEHAGCNDLRGHCLTQLGRKDEAEAHIARHLARDPDDPDAHANVGFNLLHRNRPQEAGQHFAEALRLDPENAFARAGLVEALKARNLLYRMVLGWGLWLSRMSPMARFAVVIGGLLLFQLAERAKEIYPAWTPVLLPLTWGYLFFAFCTWTAAPLFDLALMADARGRFALSQRQRRAALACAIPLALCILAVLIYPATGMALFLLIAFKIALHIPPLHTGVIAANPRHRLILLAGWTAVTVFCGIGVTLVGLEQPFGLRLLQWHFWAWLGLLFLPGFLQTRD